MMFLIAIGITTHIETNRAFTLSPIDEPSKPLSQFKTRLTTEQLEALRACAKGISLRFEKPEIVNALVSGGYAERNIAGVISVTAKGHRYLQTHTG